MRNDYSITVFVSTNIAEYFMSEGHERLKFESFRKYSAQYYHGLIWISN